MAKAVNVLDNTLNGEPTGQKVHDPEKKELIPIHRG
jgi:hypothetical protein